MIEAFSIVNPYVIPIKLTLFADFYEKFTFFRIFRSLKSLFSYKTKLSLPNFDGKTLIRDLRPFFPFTSSYFRDIFHYHLHFSHIHSLLATLSTQNDPYCQVNPGIRFYPICREKSGISYQCYWTP